MVVIPLTRMRTTMKKLLLMSAAAFSLASVSSAPAMAQTISATSPAIENFLLEVQAVQVSKAFYKGDFQSIARQNSVRSLHTGHGASLMMSVVQYRD